MSVDFGFDPILSFIGDLRDYGIEWAFRRYPGLYPGKVEDVVDDELNISMAKVSVGVVGVGTAAENDEFTPEPISRRALPTSMYAGKDHGIYFPPEKGDRVWVSFDHGDPGHPRYHGSWWLNADPNQDKSKSEIPAEFRLNHKEEQVSGDPTRRGIKTKFGHGLVFSDETTAPYVALWAGKQEGEFKAAIVRQQITLVDEDASGIPTTADEKVDAGIYANTTEGLRVELNDKDKTVLVSGKPTQVGGDIANSFKIEDTDSIITIKTNGEENQRHEVILDKKENKITIKANNAQPQTIIFDGNTGNIEVTSPLDTVITTTGAFNVNATAASTHTYSAALTHSISAAWTLTAQTLAMTMQTAWTASAQFIEFTAQNLIRLTATSAAIITAPTVNISSSTVLAGTGANLPLLNTLALAKYNTHTHIVVGALPGFALPTTGVMIPAVDTTVALLGA